MRHGLLLLIGLGCAAPLGFVNAARADAIDGDWCRSDGKRMTIRGPAIVTPGGQKTNGNYSRHYFSYEIPAGEVGAGALLGRFSYSAILSRTRAKAQMPRCRSGDDATRG